jgi:signal transduction histidine kinase
VPYVRTVHVNDSLVHDRTILGIRGGRDRLIIGLAAIQFDDPVHVVIEHRVDEDAPWQRTYGGLLDLSALAPGDHRLEVRAALLDGPWSKPLALTVVVIPRLIDRWWARVLMIIAFVSATFLLLRRFATRRLRRNEERQRERELVVHERQRIAMDLHDDLGAELSSMLLLTRLQRQHPVANGMERLEQLAGSLTEKMKEVIWSTDPGHDSLEATISFIQKHTAGVCARHGLMMRTQLPPKLPAMELSARVRRELFLLAKEALNNTLKHSGATTVSLEARTIDDSIELVFADDGRGFDQANGGRGMQNMAERARSIGAALHADGRARGARITLTLPLGDNRPNG